MSCEEFEARLTEQARGRGPDDPEARAHAAGCSGCGARLAAQREVTAALRALSTAPAGAPPRVEAALLAAFDAKKGAATLSRSWKGLSVPFFAYATAAAVLVVALTLAVLSKRSGAGSQPAAASQAAKVVRPESPAPPEIAAPAPVVQASSLPARRPAPPKPAARQRPSLATGLATDYIELIDDAGVPQTGPAPVVRMRLPRSILVSFGLPMSPDSASDTIDAEVVLNDAGAARAIRFVSY